MCFFFNDTATTEIYTYGHTLSLHVALPIGWNIVGRVRVPFGRARNRYRNVRHVARKIEARYHHRTGAIGFKAAVVKPERFRNPPRRMIGVPVQRFAMGKGLGVELGVLAAGQSDCRSRFRAYPVEPRMTHRQPCIRSEEPTSETQSHR